MNQNQTPEEIARDNIDEMLEKAGWIVQTKKSLNLGAGIGVAVREYQTGIGPADYVLFVNRKPVGIIEAKKEEEGHRITKSEEQAENYAKAKLKHIDNDPLPFVYESTGIISRFTDFRDPKPRSREVFSFHRPETLSEWSIKESLRKNLHSLHSLDHEGLRPAQIKSIENLEISFKNNKPKALIQMATGAGKTYTAATSIYRLLKHANAKRILFLVDTRNLGEQAEQEFMKYQPNDDNRKFTELYNVQRLTSRYIASDSQVCISTIQRLYSILKGQDLDDDAELVNPNESTWMEMQYKKKEPVPVEYNEKVPIEQFDFIVIDECHRSIYNLWKQVLDYFDAFLIGLTATPDKRTYAFFNGNVVNEYTYEESVLDGVNVPYDVYTIDTEITKNGATVKAGWFVDRREKLTRKKRWQMEDEDTPYIKNDLDKKVVNPDQIRTVIKEFRSALVKDIYPGRFENGEYEVPKTLIFAKTDSHASDIIDIVREEFGEGNDFCKKVTYKIDEDPKSLINRFRNSYYPRIAVTVDMIATGTDIKPLEVLLFMRDVRSAGYFQQMLGRGTRTINDNDLQMVSRTAKSKTHFIIVDAAGASKSKKTDSRPLERKPAIPLKDLLEAVAVGNDDEDLFLSLTNRLIRLDRQITEKEEEKLLEYSGGKNLKQISKELLASYDPDKIEKEALRIKKAGDYISEEKLYEEAQKNLKNIASSTFNGRLNEYLENVRKDHEQIIDSINNDTVIVSGWDEDSFNKSKKIVNDFSEYLKTNIDEFTALTIFYNEPYRRREITYQMIKDILEKLKKDKPFLAPLNVWQAFDELEEVNGRSPKNEITALISLIRRVTGLDKTLTSYNKTVDDNFKNWIFRKHSGAGVKFNNDEMDWLRMLKEHIAISFHIDLYDLELTPLGDKGGTARMYQLFGDEMNNIIDELNEVLAS